MTEQEQIMCELQAEVFEISLRRFKCSSPIFIAKYMDCSLVKELDNIDDPYNYVSPNNIIKYLSTEFPILKKKGKIKYPVNVIRWIGYIYRAYSIIYKEYSNKIYKDVKAEKMLSLFEVYHTFSAEYCVERIKELIDEVNPKKDDYEIFKSLKEKA